MRTTIYWAFTIILLSLNTILANTLPQLPQALTNNAQISILTFDSGNSLIDSFGHTAIRVKDLNTGADYVFNYGVYNFKTPNFLGKFAQGHLLYNLRVSHFKDVYQLYAQENRSITEQILDLNPKQLHKVYEYLRVNSKEENSAYYYDFFYDNCTTRALNAFQNTLGNSLQYNYDSFPSQLTHRDLLHSKLPWNSWGRLLTDLPLGAINDKPINKKYYTFLPEYTLYAFAKAKLNGKPFVKKTHLIYKSQTPAVYNTPLYKSPLLLFLILALLIIYTTLKDSRKEKRSKYLDFTIALTTGTAGLLLFLLWTATAHTPTKWNYNLLWLFPLNILAAFGYLKTQTPRWITPYTKLLLIFIVLMGLHWAMGVQNYPLVTIPVLVALFYRYFYILKTLPAVEKGKSRLF